MTKIIQRHDTAANWASVNPILAQGEMGIETDTRKFKFGDGATAWTNLAYASSEGGGGGGGTSDYNELINKPTIDSTELKGTISLAAPLKIEKSTTDSLYNASINENNQLTFSVTSGILAAYGNTSSKYIQGSSNVKINTDGTITCGSYVDLPYSLGDVLVAGKGHSSNNYFQILYGYKDKNGFRPVLAGGGYPPNNYVIPGLTLGKVITRFRTNYFTNNKSYTSSSYAADSSYNTTSYNYSWRKEQLVYDESTGFYNMRGLYGSGATYPNYQFGADMNELISKINTVRIIYTSAAFSTPSEYTQIVVKQLDSSVNPFTDMTLDALLTLPNVNIPEVAEHNVLSVGAIPNSYDGLDDKPKLNGNVLSGDINSTDLNIQRVLTPNGGISIVQNGDWHFFDASYDDTTKQITFDRYNLYDTNSDYADTFTYALNSTSSTASKIGTYVDSTKLVPTCGVIMPFYKNVTWKFGWSNFAPCNRLVFGNYIDGYFYPKYVACPGNNDVGTNATSNFKKITSISQNSQTVFTSTIVPISSTQSYSTTYTPNPVAAIGIFYDNNTYTFDFNMTTKSSYNSILYRRKKVVDSSETARLDSCTHCWYIPNIDLMGMSAGTQVATGDFCAKALIGDLSNTDMNNALILPDSGSNVFTTSISVKTDGVTTRINETGELEAIPPSNMITTENIASDATIVGMNNSIEMAQGDVNTLASKVSPLVNGLSNCLLEVPQNIKLELSNGTLTLKAGSKVIVPNGAGVFDEVVISTDLSTSGVSYSKPCFIMYDNSNKAISVRSIDQCQSGTTTPTEAISGTYIYYNTSENKVYAYSNNTWSVVAIALPLAVVRMQNAMPYIVSIDQIFNGMGYIGSTIWVDKGVKALFADGRNPDGTLKNKEVVNSVVNIENLSGQTSLLGRLVINDNSIIAVGYGAKNYFEQETPPKNFGTDAIWYNIRENQVYHTSDSGATWTKEYWIVFPKLIKSSSTGSISDITIPSTVKLTTTGSWLGMYPKVLSGSGKVVDASGDTTEGVGAFTLTLYNNGQCRIDFSFKITTAGTAASNFNWGFSAALLKSINPDVPNITPSYGGYVVYLNSNGTKDDSLNGYGGCATRNSNGSRWIFGRVYQTAGEFGSWNSSKFTVGTFVYGCVIGTFDINEV